MKASDKRQTEVLIYLKAAVKNGQALKRVVLHWMFFFQEKENARPKPRREQRKAKMNEYIQTDLEKGVASSGQEAGVTL